MVTEIAYLQIDPAQAAAFEAAVASCAPLFREAAGCSAMALERVVEDPAQYRLLVEWKTVDHHMVDFRQSPAFEQWRSTVGPFFTGPPRVEHLAKVAVYFDLAAGTV